MIKKLHSLCRTSLSYSKKPGKFLSFLPTKVELSFSFIFRTIRLAGWVWPAAVMVPCTRLVDRSINIPFNGIRTVIGKVITIIKLLGVSGPMRLLRQLTWLIFFQQPNKDESCTAVAASPAPTLNILKFLMSSLPGDFLSL